MARWLGESQSAGQGMTYYLLPISGIPIVCSSVQPISEEEIHADEVT